MGNPIIEDTQVYKSKATTNYYNEPKYVPEAQIHMTYI